jgi:hypothetical protein
MILVKMIQLLQLAIDASFHLCLQMTGFSAAFLCLSAGQRCAVYSMLWNFRRKREQKLQTL